MNKAIFWDLQGTLGGDAVGSIENFCPYAFSKDALNLAKQLGFMNIILTNQSRIGKGLLSLDNYLQSERQILDYFNDTSILIDDILCCPHSSKDMCRCKKPKTGMIDECVQKYGLDIRKCYVIGDIGKNEIVLAHNAGCKGILVLTGGGKDSLGIYRNTWCNHEADHISENALAAVHYIRESKNTVNEAG